MEKLKAPMIKQTKSTADGFPNEKEKTESDASPEAAGIARGAVKTATALSKRGMLGRLPKPSAPPIPVPKTQLPRMIPGKRLPLKQVAKISDRISTGFDAYDAATSVVEEGRAGTDNNSRKAIWKNYGMRIGSFAGMLFKNTLLGTAAFEAYEKTIEFLIDSRQSKDILSENGERGTNVTDGTVNVPDIYAQASVMQHFNAGIIAGSAHSSLALVFQSVSFLHMNGTNPNKIATLPSVSLWGICHTLHHSTSYALLFSSYETSKRLLTNANDGGTHSFQGLLSIGLAGGIAGQVQHIASHYTEFWLRVTEEQSVHTFLTDIRRQVSSIKFFHPGPSMKSTALAFPPSAIGFVAFEYGKGLLSSDD